MYLMFPVGCPSRRSFALWLGFLLCLPGLADAQTPLVNHGDSWRYRDGTNAPAATWKTMTDASLDATWLTGNGGFGYADNTTETALVLTLLPTMRNNFSTLYMRKAFVVSGAPDPTMRLALTMDWDDGFIAWLDGVFLASANSPGSPAEPAFNALATALHESSHGDSTKQPPTTYDLGAVGSRLAVGTHVLAILGLNQSLTASSDFIQIADLALTVPIPNSVSGPISVNTTWYLSNSPITAVGPVTVNSGVTLTIEPGVQVRFESGVPLIVDGRVLAEGTPAAHIQFVGAPAVTDWGGITVNGTVGSPETRILYGDFGGNGTTAIHAAGGTVFLDHLTFAAHDHQYISLDGASFVVSHCVFPTATASFELCHGTGGIKSGGHGLFLRNFFGSTLGYNDVVDFTGGNRPGGALVHFINNVFTGGQDDGVDLDGTDAWVEGNIFMHIHRNGTTPDSSAAVSGGNFGSDTSEITVVGNIFFDCDNAATAKQTNFFTFYNNTIVHITKTGGIDGGSGVINVRDTTPSLTSFGKGYYMEGNIISDVEQLVRNYDPTQGTVTFSNNILPVAWTGPGGANLIADPLFKHVPTLAETVFANWDSAQIMWDWFSLQTNSPGVGTGPNGLDKGAVVPRGASISGAPSGTTTRSNATLVVGVNRSGSGIPVAGWPSGCGYTHYRWRIDGGAWSVETPIGVHIGLTRLIPGAHYVEVTGKLDTGLYQDDPLFAEDAVLSSSGTWVVQSLVAPLITSLGLGGGAATVTFQATAGQTYSAFYRDGLEPGVPWLKFQDVPAPQVDGPQQVTDPGASSSLIRFYRLVTPATTP